MRKRGRHSVDRRGLFGRRPASVPTGSGRALRVAAGVSGVLLGAGLVALLGTGLWLSTRPSPVEPTVTPPPPPRAPEASVTTTLLFGTREQQPGGPVVWMDLLSYDAATDSGAVVYIPSHTAVEVPGRGLMAVGESLRSGGVPLLLVSVETLLGVPVDHYVELSDSDAVALFEEVGAITVDVPGEVRVRAGVNETRLVFDDGPQRLPPRFLGDLLFTIGAGGDDAELGGRHLAFLKGLFDKFANDPSELERRVTAAGGSLAESDLSPERVGDLLRRLAELPVGDRALASLPVQPVSVAGDELYRSEPAELAAFLDETVGDAPEETGETLVQILNGNGVPGIGQQVAEELGGADFRVILSGNAQRLDYRRTQIVTYDGSAEGLGTARRVREILGVGEVKTSSQGQDIVDLTIVVGKDYLR